MRKPSAAEDAVAVEREWWTALVRVLAHDAQTPITTVVGFAQTLQRPGLPPEVQASSLAAISRGGLRLSLLLRNLVEASRLRTDELVVRLGPVPLDEAVQRARTRVADLVDPDHSVEVVGSGTTVVADRERLASVLVNVVHNALSFSPPGRPVVVHVEGSEVRVDDEGPGFTPDDLAHATEPFWRGADTPGAGAGLGLHVAARLIEAMGGRVELATGGPEGGARVRLVLRPA